MISETFKQGNTEWLLQCYPIPVEPLKPKTYRVNLSATHSNIPFLVFEFIPSSFGDDTESFRTVVLKQVQKQIGVFLSGWSNIE